MVGDAEELPFDDDQFDIYTIAFGIRNVTHVDQVTDRTDGPIKIVAATAGAGNFEFLFFFFFFKESLSFLR